MKKKVLYGAAMACFAFAAMGTLQSCKDELSDFKHQYTADQFNMNGLIETLRGDLNDAKKHCADEIARLEGEIAKNSADIAANKGDINQLKIDLQALEGEVANRVTLDQFNQKITELEAAYKSYADQKFEEGKDYTDEAVGHLKTELEETINSQVYALQALIDQLGADTQIKFDNVQQQLTQITTQITSMGEQIDALQEAVVTATTKADNALAAIDAINEELDNIKSTLGNHEDLLADLRTDLNTLRTEYEAEVENIKNDIQAKYDELWNEIMILGFENEQIREEIGRVYLRIGEINDRIDAIDAQFLSMTNRLNDLLTSILVQGTDNPIFGNFSLPLGIKSNLAFDWYGKFVNDVDFPSSSKAYSYNSDSPVLTKEDLAFLINSGLAIDSEEAGFKVNGSLGKVYMTLNPIGHNLTLGKTFSLQTSAENTLPFKLKAEECNDELSFGYSRSASNGFYSAEVMMEPTASDIDAVAVRIDDGLKEAAKDILHDRTKRNALNLLKAVYHQLDGMLPAYAMRADWTSGDNKYAVVSGYDIAVATAKPLSYKFCFDKSIDHRLPTYGHIENLLERLINKDDFKIKINQKFELNDFTITFSDLTFDFSKVDVSIKPEDRKPITITIPSIEVIENGVVVGRTEETLVNVPASDLAGMYDAIEKGLKDAVKNLGNDLQGQINEQIREKLIKGIQDDVNDMLKDIEKQVNDMLASLEKDINGQISDMIDNVVDKAEPYFARLNKVIDLYNKVAGKINNFLADPNHYLQVCAFYKGNGTVGILSNAKNDPTIFNYAGGNAISLFLSSYTAETVCPAYKKYAAVVNVYDANGNSVREAEKSSLQKMNAEGRGLNKVLTGRTFRVAIPAKYMKAGYTYEIVYQGLDYSGVTSTQKFYIKVK